MDTQLVLFLGGCIVALVSVIYAALLYEVRKLRKQGHQHANAIVVLNLGLSLVCRKLGIEWMPLKPRDGDDD